MLQPHELDGYLPETLRIEEPASCVPSYDASGTPRPATLRTASEREAWPMSLEEAVRLALESSEVIRQLGVGVLTNISEATPTVYDVALQETSPLDGVDAALSAFDAQLESSLFLDRNERALNNLFFGGGTTTLNSNTAAFQGQIGKTTATGAQFFLRHNLDYNRNNSPANLFPSAWDALLEGEMRLPLLQGAGVAFNRIAGPNATPGQYNGVVIARLKTDVRLADFEAGVRDFLFEVEQAYWDLYFSYREVDTVIDARDALLENWRVVRNKFEAGEADREEESLARERYYGAQATVERAMSTGVLSGERRLRVLLGLPVTDGRLIRPSDQPVMADISFDWDAALLEGLTRRVELRRQHWRIKQREMELLAAQNWLRARVDFVGQYRKRGFGDNLLDEGGGTPADSAYEDLFGGDLEGWQLGVQASMPIGNRIGHLTVRNAQLAIARERALYRQQEQYVIETIAQALTDLDQAYTLARTNYNRRLAAKERVQQVQLKFDAGLTLLQFVLDAQREASIAELAFFRAVVDYNLAIARFHLAKGTLLDYQGVYLAEGPSPVAAHQSAARLARYRNRHLNYHLQVPAPVSLGPVDPGVAAELPEAVSESIPPGRFEVAPPEVELPKVESGGGTSGSRSWPPPPPLDVLPPELDPARD